MNHCPVDGRYTAMSVLWSVSKSAAGRGGAHDPPLTHAVVVMNSDQQLSVPVSCAASSAIRSFHVPLSAEPLFPMKPASEPSGRNVPTNGAVPDVIAVAAASSNVVRLLCGEQLDP
jgi:hypothetical protein